VPHGQPCAALEQLRHAIGPFVEIFGGVGSARAWYTSTTEASICKPLLLSSSGAKSCTGLSPAACERRRPAAATLRDGTRRNRGDPSSDSDDTKAAGSGRGSRRLLRVARIGTWGAQTIAFTAVQAGADQSVRPGWAPVLHHGDALRNCVRDVGHATA